jgi:hypothetical protein
MGVEESEVTQKRKELLTPMEKTDGSSVFIRGKHRIIS